MNVPPTRLDDLVNAIRKDQQHYVDATTWEDDWDDTWVGFSDVLGFGARCLKSEPTTVNTIVRFHRSIAASAARFGPEELRLFRFTDAVYSLSSSLETILRFTSMLQHQCLAHNRIVMRDKDHPLAHHLLLVRTTIAHGRALTLADPPPPVSKTLGVEARTLLAGSGIVRAYQLEKNTVGGIVSLSKDDADRIPADVTVRGQLGRPRTLMEAWGTDTAAFHHDGVVDFPWALLRPVQETSELWVDSKDGIRAKLNVLVEACDLLSGEFLLAQAPLQVAKHRAGLMRHVNELTQRLENHESLRRWGEHDVRTALDL